MSGAAAVERWNRASGFAMAGAVAILAALSVGPFAFGAGTVDRLTTLFI